jgi:simple sugar transport system ATP-binding protein
MVNARDGQAQGPVLEVRGLRKSYGHVTAIRNANLSLSGGEVLGLLGDNGAGKSTLVKCISGQTQPDEGQIRVDGKEVTLSSTSAAQELGIETVFQDLALIPTLDVAANLFMNRELLRRNPVLRSLGWMDKRAMYEQAGETLSRLHIRIHSARQQVADLSGGQRQSVAVGRAVSWGRHIVILDEPSAALGVEQSRLVLDLIRRLREEGVAVLLITHNMHEVMEVCDRAVIMRHGTTIAELNVADVSMLQVITLVTGADDDLTETA